MQMPTPDRCAPTLLRARSVFRHKPSGPFATLRAILAAALLMGGAQAVQSQSMPSRSGLVPGAATIHYQIHGSDAGPPVLLVHWFGGSFDTIRLAPIINLLSDYMLIGIDVRGHGKSAKPDAPGDYGLALVEDLNRLLDHLELSSAHVIGVSMGGIVGLKHASLYPARVRSLTLVGQGLVPAENYQQWVQMGQTVMNSGERTAEQQATLHLYSGFLSGYPPLLVTEQEASALDVPLLIVIGEDDERLGSARKLKSAYPFTNLIVAPGFDHFDIMEPQSPLYLSLVGFLRREEKQYPGGHADRRR